jgi:protein SCO1/2
MIRKPSIAIILLLPLAALCVSPAGQPVEPAAPADADSILEQVGLDQKLGEQVPLGLEFRDESGRTVHLRDYFGERPVVLTLVYYECPMLCSLILNGTVRALRTLEFTVGREFDVLTVSIDPDETPELAAAKRTEYLSSYRREGAEKGWHFLTGREDQIRPLADSVGFRYAFDPASGEYAHAAGIMVLTPEGKVARYFYGVEYSPRDLKLGLIEASEKKIGSPVDQLLLLCYHYNPLTGRYNFAVMTAVRVGGALTVLGIVALLWTLIRRERKSGSAAARV